MEEREGLGRRRMLLGCALAVGGGIALAALLSDARGSEVDPVVALLFLGLAVACAIVGGMWAALLASLTGAVLLNYFFTTPFHSLNVASRENLAMLAVFVVVSASVAAVVGSAARQRHLAALARREADTLGTLNRTVLGGEYDVPGVLELVRSTLGSTGARLMGSDAPAPRDATIVPAGKDARLVVTGWTPNPVGQRILTAFAAHLGVLQERAESARQASAARELEAGNRIRTALLAAVSHDLRTPLSGIRSAAETLRTHGSGLSSADQDTLLAAIEDSTGRLTTMVSDLLDMSRLQTGAVVPELTEVSLNEVVDAVTPATATIRVGALPVALADRALLERVLANLLSNAARFSDQVEVVGAVNRDGVDLLVVDHGPGVPDADRQRIFEPFQRLGDVPVGEGVGLGLAVARGLTEAQHGTLSVEDTRGGGLTMRLHLRAP